MLVESKFTSDLEDTLLVSYEMTSIINHMREIGYIILSQMYLVLCTAPTTFPEFFSLAMM
jgi:hypothetical protein